MARFARSVTGLMTISYAPHAVPDGVGVVLVTFAATVHTKGHTSSVKVATKIKIVIRIKNSFSFFHFPLLGSTFLFFPSFVFVEIFKFVSRNFLRRKVFR